MGHFANGQVASQSAYFGEGYRESLVPGNCSDWPAFVAARLKKTDSKEERVRALLVESR